MFLTQLCLDQLDRTVLKNLSDVYRFHQWVMKGFTGQTDAARVLYRVEPEVRNGRVVVLVQSQSEPDWESIRDGLVGVHVKDFSPVLNAESHFRFRLRANPTVTREGKRYGLIRDADLLDWLHKKEERLGSRIMSARVVDEGYATGRKPNKEKGHRLAIKTARFEGVMEVVDPSRLTEAVTNGIGPGKAFGCGLLSLARV